ncbi:hypothetical protein ACFX12_012676 [Malus domestica]
MTNDSAIGFSPCTRTTWIPTPTSYTAMHIVGNLIGVAFSPRNLKRKPIDTFRALFGNDYNICRFQLLKPATQLEKKNTQASEHAAASPSCK